jgi:hypothetical protein
LEVNVATVYGCEEKNEEKFEALEEEAPDALEVAAQKDEEGKKKKDTALQVSVFILGFFFCRLRQLVLAMLNRKTAN